MPIERSIPEVLNAHRDAMLADMRKCIPATVTAIYPDRQTVDVQICVNRLLFTDLGDAVEEDAPSLSDVPLGVMRGGGFLVWLPIAVGDSVLLVFSDWSADTWRAGDGSARSPSFAGMHTADSPFALPMFSPDAKMLTSPNDAPTKVIIGKDGSDEQILISNTDIELGRGATAAAALATKIDSLINVLVATYTPSGTETGFTALVAALATWKSANWTGTPTVGATLVKAK